MLVVEVNFQEDLMPVVEVNSTVEVNLEEE